MPTSDPPDPEEVAYKLRRCHELHRSARERAPAGLKLDHPEATREKLIEFFRQRLERIRATKWDGFIRESAAGG